MKPREMTKDADQVDKHTEDAVLTTADQVRVIGGSGDKTESKEGANEKKPENKKNLKESDEKEDDRERGREKGKEDLVYPNRTGQGIQTRTRARRKSPACTRAGP